jgi:hypothetical protein
LADVAAISTGLNGSLDPGRSEKFSISILPPSECAHAIAALDPNEYDVWVPKKGAE